MGRALRPVAPGRRLLAGVALATAVLGGIGVATAQEEPPATAIPPSPQGRLLTNQVERHLADLHRRLRITTAEQAPFDAFALVMRQNAAHAAEMLPTPADGQQSAVANLRAYAERARQRADDVARLVPAFEALYSAMTPEQQKIADTVVRDVILRGGRPPLRP